MRRTRVGSVNERFAQRFEIDPDSGCWIWTGTMENHGYGVISGTLNGLHFRKLLAHRASWLIFRGEIPNREGEHGTVVMHTCDNRRCVNPAHLELGSQADNVKDMNRKGRHVVGEFQKRKGVDHIRSAFKDQAEIDLICSTVGQTKQLAEKFGVDVCTIKRIRRRNGIIRDDAEKYVSKSIPQEVIDHIRSTPPGTRGLTKLYGLSKTTIARIRQGITYKSS